MEEVSQRETATRGSAGGVWLGGLGVGSETDEMSEDAKTEKCERNAEVKN